MTGRTIAASLLLAACLTSPSLAQQDSVIYVIAPGSRFEVTTHKSGVFSFVGHEHLIRARSFSGKIVYFPSALERSRLEIVVPSDSLEVLTPPDTAEIRKVTAAMRTDVLDVAHHPEIRFVSRNISVSNGTAHLVAQLTIRNQTREVPLDAQIDIGSDTLRATTTFTIQQ